MSFYGEITYGEHTYGINVDAGDNTVASSGDIDKEQSIFRVAGGNSLSVTEAGVVNITLFKEIGRILHSTSFFFKTFFEELTERVMSITSTYSRTLYLQRDMGGRTLQSVAELGRLFIKAVGKKTLHITAVAGGYLIKWRNVMRCRIWIKPKNEEFKDRWNQ